MGTVLVALLLLLALGFLALLGFGGLWALGSHARDGGRRAAHDERAAETLNELLADAPLQAVYKAPDTSGGISSDVLVREANARGYKVVSEQGQMAARRVVLERVRRGTSER